MSMQHDAASDIDDVIRSLTALHLRAAHIWHHELDEEHRIALAVALVLHSADPKLVEFELVEAGLTAATLAPLVQPLAALGTLTWLDLRQNSLGDAGAQLVATCFRGHRALEVLILNGCAITSSGGESLLRLLPDCPKLRDLWLRDNDLCDSFVLALAKTLPSSASIQRINLRQNVAITSACANALVEAIPSAPLLSLSVSGTSMWRGDRQRVKSACVAPKRRALEAIAMLLLGLTRPRCALPGSSLHRLRRHSIFDMNALTLVFEMLTGRTMQRRWVNRTTTTRSEV